MIVIAPGEDCAILALIKKRDPTSGRRVPLTTGTGVAFVSADGTSGAAAADSDLSVTVTCTNSTKGEFLAPFDATKFTRNLLITNLGYVDGQELFIHFRVTGAIAKVIPAVFADVALEEVEDNG